MSCPSLQALSRDCSGAQIGGAEVIYAIAYKDLAAVNSGTTEVYTASTNNIVVGVGFSGSSRFNKISVAKNSAGFTEALTKDLTTGTNFIAQTVTINLQGLSSANRNFVESVRYQPIAIIVKTRTKKYFLIGASGELELATLETGSGVSAEEGQSYKMTFTGINPDMALPIDESIITSLLA
jgi:hypothetical protein